MYVDDMLGIEYYKSGGQGYPYSWEECEEKEK